jgi:hypothetical protein
MVKIYINHAQNIAETLAAFAGLETNTLHL